MAMFEDDEGFGFEDEDFDPEEANQEWQQERERLAKLPIMLKAQEILDTVDSLSELIEEEGVMGPYRDILFGDASIICTKIAGAESRELYSLRMENAVIIKIHAKNLLTQIAGLEMMGFKEKHYLDVLRQEIEEFRLLFIEWVDRFDKSKDIPDNWGELFR